MVVAHGGRGLGLAGEPLRAVALVASCAAITLMATTRCSLLVERPQHDAHAAAADNLEDLVMAQPAQYIRLVGRGQEAKALAWFFVPGSLALRFAIRLPQRQFLGDASGASLPMKLPAST